MQFQLTLQLKWKLEATPITNCTITLMPDQRHFPSLYSLKLLNFYFLRGNIWGIHAIYFCVNPSNRRIPQIDGDAFAFSNIKLKIIFFKANLFSIIRLHFCFSMILSTDRHCWQKISIFSISGKTIWTQVLKLFQNMNSTRYSRGRRLSTSGFLT